MVRSVPRGKGLSKGLSSRLGAPAGGVKKVQGDARMKIIQSSRSKTVDARDKLAQLAKKTDAREKLKKMRNLKDGKLEVKDIGGIIRTKQINGKLELTTKKAGAKKVERSPAEVKKVGNFTKTVFGSGKMSLTTGKSRPDAGMRSKSESSRNTGLLRNSQSGRNGRERLSETERLDEELMLSSLNKEDLHRMKDLRLSSRSADRSGMRSRSPLNPRSRSPLRSRSPRRSRSPLRSRSPIRSYGREDWKRREPSPARRGGRFDYDDPSRNSRDDEDLLRRRSKTGDFDEGFTMGGRLEQISKVSPLQGSKVVITNLQTSVTQEDIMELFGDVGALRRAKLLAPGHAEVTFVNHSHAVKAVEIYHNRQLDAKPMKCQLVGATSAPMPSSSRFRLPSSLTRSKSGDLGPAPDVESIHRALFFNKKASAKKPVFTITMPKKGKEEPEYYE